MYTSDSLKPFGTPDKVWKRESRRKKGGEKRKTMTRKTKEDVNLADKIRMQGLWQALILLFCN